MMIIFYLLLMLRAGRCAHDPIFDTKTVGVGDDVTLTCPRQKNSQTEYFFWIRLVSGNFPETFKGTHQFEYNVVHMTPRTATKQGPETFLLQINKTEPSDTGVYYCIEVDLLDMTFLKGTFLRIKEPDITATIQDLPSDPVRPGDSVTLQCSVLSDSETKMCEGQHSVFWFRSGSDESHPKVIYAHGNSGDGCEKSPEAHAPQKCIYNFSKNVSSSDAGTYYCAVATCGEIFFGDRAKLEIEVNMWDLEKANTVLFLLCAALAISLIVHMYTIKKKTCDCCNAVISKVSREMRKHYFILPQPSTRGKLAKQREGMKKRQRERRSTPMSGREIIKIYWICLLKLISFLSDTLL
ncbi:signal-regulatory protein beta-2-like isoform X2 [Cottoperca gobio]|uniref:Signal-regulatory protein beta-2-like isoform X2 n=1 Tax=Cottoperca gobio TaxID=56716 RepID=A0A6J2QHT1_COTGO|nr:signal-regulatory protein beta-2-like isoform X2 [Cottoperca gobio]